MLFFKYNFRLVLDAKATQSQNSVGSKKVEREKGEKYEVELQM